MTQNRGNLKIDEIFASEGYIGSDNESDQIEQINYDPTDVNPDNVDNLLGAMLTRSQRLYDLSYHVANTDRSPRSIEVAAKVLGDLLKTTLELKRVKDQAVQSEQPGENANVIFKGNLSDLIDAIR